VVAQAEQAIGQHTQATEPTVVQVEVDQDITTAKHPHKEMTELAMVLAALAQSDRDIPAALDIPVTIQAVAAEQVAQELMPTIKQTVAQA
jgi:hypothetical protein